MYPDTLRTVLPELFELAAACPSFAAFRQALVALPMDEVHFMANREGGQSRGAVYTVSAVTEDAFDEHVRPLLWPGHAKNAAVYRARHPEARLLLQDGRFQRLRPDEDLRIDMERQVLSGWALPAAVAGRITSLADSDQTLDYLAIYQSARGRDARSIAEAAEPTHGERRP